MTRGQIVLLVALGALVLAVYALLGLLATGRIPLGLPPVPTSTPPPAPTALPVPGDSRQNPIPLGQSAAADSLEISILEVHRDAKDFISPFNDPVPDSQEAVVLEVVVKNLSQNAVSISPGIFRLAGSLSRLYQRPSLILDGELRGEVAPGAELKGNLAFLVGRDEENLALVYIPAGSIADPGTRWLWADDNPDFSLFNTNSPNPTASPRAGGSRSEPAQMGQPVVADDRLEVTVLDATRDAWAAIQKMSPLNQPPEPDKEYVLVRLKTRFLGENDQLLSVNWWSFRMTGAENILYPNPSLILTDELKGDLFPDGELEGSLAFQVRKGEKNLILVYDPTGVGAKLGRGVRWLWATESPDESLLNSPVYTSLALPASGRSPQQPAPAGIPVLAEGDIELVVEAALALPADAVAWERWTLPPPENGRRYLIVTVKVSNFSKEGRPQGFHWQGFLLREPYGASFYKPILLGGSELEGETFAGANITAHLAFAIAGNHKYVLSYDPTGLGVPASFRWFVIETE